MVASAIKTMVYGVQGDGAFDLVARALASLGMAIEVADPAMGTIQARSSRNVGAWGETIQVQLRHADGGTQIQVTSSLKFGVFDWGRNNSNVTRVHQAIAAELTRPAATSAAPAAWHPDPYGRHEHRWWDGMQWTGTVSDRGVVASDPPPA